MHIPFSEGKIIEIGVILSKLLHFKVLYYSKPLYYIVSVILIFNFIMDVPRALLTKYISNNTFYNYQSLPISLQGSQIYPITTIPIAHSQKE
ncbi:hypothetical protein RCL_jg17105.t1 [Rhizophagus clarus]|uniref:Uncharacterized protein n=1 Tax=Rhizophagus clarus TaxID=94130 RepID=A0A8H3LPU6_9GLOM|nr:hypothetical protein RCL_jg17105.t1 [Rhizophagus clarus]